MPSRDHAAPKERRAAGATGWLHVALPGALGLALVGAGLLLSSSSGAFVTIGESVRAAVAWCF